MYQFSSKMEKFDFSVPNLAKKWILSSKLRKQMLKQESASSRYHVCQLLDKTNNFDFFGPNLPKKEFKVGNHKTNVGIRISIVKISCVPIFRKNGQLWLFRPKFAQKWILESGFQKSKSEFGICTSKIPYVSLFS